MHTHKVFCFVVLLAGMLSLPGCQKDQPEGQKAETVLIGVIFPFSGHSGASGEDMRSAVLLAEEIINDSFDLPVPLAKGQGLPALGGGRIKVLFVDSESEDKKAPELVIDLVKKERVVAIMGCYNSAVTATASEQAEAMRIPFLNPDSTSPVLVQRGLKWFFRTTPDDAMFAENFFAFLSDLREQKEKNVPKRLTLVYENRLWGTSVARAERGLAEKYGYEIVEDVTYSTQDDQFDEELMRIKRAMPSIVLQSSYARDAVLFMEGYKAQQIGPVAILAMDAGFISPSFLADLGRDGDYIFSREVWALDIAHKKPLVRLVNDLFRKRFNRNMTGNSARAFTGLIVLADAINRAGTTAPAGIRAALLKTHISGENLIMPWDGVQFDPDTGQNVLGQGLIVQVQDGEYVTVWPETLSTHPIIWPMPPWEKRKLEN